VQQVIGPRIEWPTYIILKTFGSWLAVIDLKVLAIFYVGNCLSVDLFVKLLRRVNRHMTNWKETYVRNFISWVRGDERFRVRYSYYNVRRRMVMDFDGNRVSYSTPLCWVAWGWQHCESDDTTSGLGPWYVVSS
jgi:hypothetical protein